MQFGKPKNAGPPPELLWKEWDRKANKDGLRHTVYFVAGDKYTGEWKDNQRHGKGTFEWKNNGAVYDGEWLAGRRCGFGTYSLPQPDGTYRKVYAGGWKDDKRHGYGVHYYGDSEYFEGEWYADKRCGWGRMHYADGSKYEGEWFDDKSNGRGMVRLPNGNRYEGAWRNGKKHGAGKFFYLDKGKLFEGVWVEDIPKCGEMIDFGREQAPEPTQFPIPQCELAESEVVLTEAKHEVLQHAFEGIEPASFGYEDTAVLPWLAPPVEGNFTHRYLTDQANEYFGVRKKKHLAARNRKKGLQQ